MKDVCRVCAGKGIVRMYHSGKEMWYPKNRPRVWHNTVKTYFKDEWCKACDGKGWADYSELDAK